MIGEISINKYKFKIRVKYLKNKSNGSPAITVFQDLNEPGLGDEYGSFYLE